MGSRLAGIIPEKSCEKEMGFCRGNFPIEHGQCHFRIIGSSTIWDLVGSLRWLADRRRAPFSSETATRDPGLLMPSHPRWKSQGFREFLVVSPYPGFHGVPKLLKPANIMKLATNWGNCYVPNSLILSLAFLIPQNIHSFFGTPGLPSSLKGGL